MRSSALFQRTGERALPGIFACFLACSTDAGGPRPVTIAVRVTDANDLDEAITCVRLPVLLGSRVNEATPVPSGFQIEISASRDWVEVSFPGAIETGTIRAVQSQLENGHSDSIAITDPDGGTHMGYLFTGCTPVYSNADE